jgi:predicted TIM-barrel fold metal-dependent hydrolase
MNRLDKEYLERRREVPYLTERPSHYLERVYVATQPIEEPERLGDIVKLVELYRGEDRTMFASDWPHHDFDHPMKLNQVPFSQDAKRKIFGENALEFFQIDATGRRLNRPERRDAI